MSQRRLRLPQVLTSLLSLTIELRWQSVDEKKQFSYTVGDEIDKQLLKDYDICLTGPALAKFDPETHQSIILDLLNHTWVYARVSPAQKVFPNNSQLIAGIHFKYSESSGIHH